MAGFVDFMMRNFQVGTWNISIFNIIFSVVLFAIGIFLGKSASFILKKWTERTNLQRTIRQSFINLFLTVVRWAIYILFINLVFQRLNLPQVTEWITSVLIIIPALVGALLLIVVGFAIAVYLRDIIEESGIIHARVLSMIMFYFVLYVFMIFALRTALISQDKIVVNSIVIILTAVTAVSIAFWHSRHARKK
ncbi:MAG TPA: hypothetical protein VJA86_01785 [Candidatus Nanoarchaeia archaeon]|nr:hypothetical protein [Candidatus Nanoarchaeia archaeon]